MLHYEISILDPKHVQQNPSGSSALNVQREPNGAEAVGASKPAHKPAVANRTRVGVAVERTQCHLAQLARSVGSVR